jgi:hypothetical protein
MTYVNASTDGEGIVIREHLDCSKEELWDSITDADELSAWLGGNCVIDPDVGGLVRFELPDAGLVATGVVRDWSPPVSSRSVAAIEHTLVDEAQSNVTWVCNWVLSASGSGCDLRFSLEGVDESDRARLAAPWRRLGLSASAHGSAPKRRTTTPGSPRTSLAALWRPASRSSPRTDPSRTTTDAPRSVREQSSSPVSSPPPGPTSFTSIGRRASRSTSAKRGALGRGPSGTTRPRRRRPLPPTCAGVGFPTQSRRASVPRSKPRASHTSTITTS